jgi:hypothetical protein
MRRTPGGWHVPLVASAVGGLSGAALSWMLSHIGLIAWAIVDSRDKYGYYLLGQSDPPLPLETLYRLGYGCLFGATTSLLPMKRDRTAFWVGAVVGFLAAVFYGGTVIRFRE